MAAFELPNTPPRLPSSKRAWAPLLLAGAALLVSGAPQPAPSRAVAVASAGAALSAAGAHGPAAPSGPAGLPLAAPTAAHPQAHTDRAVAVRAQLDELEARAASSLAECAHWFDLSVLYAELSHQQRPREAELRKRAECDQLDHFVVELRDRLARLAELTRAQPQLGAALELLAEFGELRRAAHDSSLVAGELQALQASVEPSTRAGLQSLEALLGSLEQRWLEQRAGQPQPQAAAQPAAQAQPAAELDEIGQLDAAVRELVDRELQLSDEELSQLIEWADLLEQLLASPAVDPHSGRQLYLSGSLNAARAVVLRSITGHRAAGPIRSAAGAAAKPDPEPAEARAARKLAKAEAQLAQAGLQPAAHTPLGR